MSVSISHPVPHAQRWREYHNATHGPGEQTPIYTAYGVQVNRIRTRVLPPGGGRA